MKVFDTPQADELAVIDSDGKVLSVLWEDWYASATPKS